MVTVPTRSLLAQPLKCIAMGLCVMLLTVACSREQQDWRSAEAADTIEAYGRFIEGHPESELAGQARLRIAQLGEDQDWQRAGSADTADAYREFMVQHPNGRWAQEARIRIQNFSLGDQTPEAAPAPATSPAAPAAATSPAASATVTSAAAPPTSPPAVPALAPAATLATPSAVPSPGEFGVQLGAFSNEGAARSQWRALTAGFAQDLQGLQERIVPADTPSGRIYRLQAVVGTEARARAICDSLRLHAQACVAVLPH